MDPRSDWILDMYVVLSSEGLSSVSAPPLCSLVLRVSVFDFFPILSDTV